jgi:FlaA1/EpsC-like NDP-sugar epimerase
MTVKITLQEVFGKSRVLSALDVPTSDFYDQKIVAVFGGAGSIGSRIVNSLLEFTTASVVMIDSDESRIHSTWVSLSKNQQGRTSKILCDIRDERSVESCYEMYKFDIVINAAALKHVTYLEEFPREGYMTNVIGALNVISMAVKYQVSNFLFVSTDKAADPTNMLGKTKLIGERILSTFAVDSNKSATTFSCVRFGNVFMSRGSVVETFLAQISKGEPLTVNSKDMTRFFIDIDDAANLILETVAMEKNGIVLLNMGKSESIYQLALKLLQLTDTDLEIIEVGAQSGEKTHEVLVSNSESAESFYDERMFFVAFDKNVNVEAIGSRIPKSHKETIAQVDFLLEL